ncbi:MAG TPA: LysR substrate-binding domain-containing protein [Ramlibacter sp.]|uniref:LysR substrate-binding domain-containing protein n=1 Tax=Ramlibacter sp. TaxID=1917967 RepID=UPI002D7E2013|nr:LysR substrate-binding domain-containing protein [Ramlibacter sp.]HET8747336.1 LysR substrate-binding domain-containing protein [Ramlibacter sp.]
MQDLNDMLFFAEVVDQGGFAAAGRALKLPKSRLSRRIADLEARLGVRLLHRTTRKLSLTPAGETYHRHCVAVREQAEAAEEAVMHVQTEPRGTVRITCPVTLAQTTIGPLLPRFLAAHPQVRIDMQVTNRVIDLVQEGVDVALRVRSSVDDSGTLVIKNLGETHGVLVASPQLLQRFGTPANVEALHHLPTVAMSAADGRANWHLDGPRDAHYELQHRPVYTADDLMALKYAVLQGTGMSVLPDYLCREEMRRGDLVPVLPGWAPPVARVLAVYPSRRGMVPAVRRLLDFLGENVIGESIAGAADLPRAKLDS